MLPAVTRQVSQLSGNDSVRPLLPCKLPHSIPSRSETLQLRWNPVLRRQLLDGDAIVVVASVQRSAAVARDTVQHSAECVQEGDGDVVPVQGIRGGRVVIRSR